MQEGQLENRRQALSEAVDELLAANGTRTLGLILNNQRPADLAEHPRLPYAI